MRRKGNALKILYLPIGAQRDKNNKNDLIAIRV